MPNWITIKPASDSFDPNQSTVGGKWKTIKPALGQSTQEKLRITQENVQKSLEQFQKQENGFLGIKGAIKGLLGIKESLPNLANETPEYTQQRTQSEQYQPSLGEKIGSFIGKSPLVQSMRHYLLQDNGNFSE